MTIILQSVILTNKLRIYIQYNPGWITKTYGHIPNLPKIGAGPLTPKEKETVIALSKEGKSDRCIAKELGRDVTTIGNCVNEYREKGGKGVRGPRCPRTTEEERKEMLRLSESGIMQKDIAKKLGKSPTCVCKMLKQMRSSPTPKGT